MAKCWTASLTLVWKFHRARAIGTERLFPKQISKTLFSSLQCKKKTFTPVGSAMQKQTTTTQTWLHKAARIIMCNFGGVASQGGVSQQEGGPPRQWQWHTHDSIRPIRLTVALGLKRQSQREERERETALEPEPRRDSKPRWMYFGRRKGKHVKKDKQCSLQRRRKKLLQQLTLVSGHKAISNRGAVAERRSTRVIEHSDTWTCFLSCFASSTCHVFRSVTTPQLNWTTQPVMDLLCTSRCFWRLSCAVYFVQKQHWGKQNRHGCLLERHSSRFVRLYRKIGK